MSTALTTSSQLSLAIIHIPLRLFVYVVKLQTRCIDSINPVLLSWVQTLALIRAIIRVVIARKRQQEQQRPPPPRPPPRRQRASAQLEPSARLPPQLAESSNQHSRRQRPPARRSQQQHINSDRRRTTIFPTFNSLSIELLAYTFPYALTASLVRRTESLLQRVVVATGDPSIGRLRRYSKVLGLLLTIGMLGGVNVLVQILRIIHFVWMMKDVDEAVEEIKRLQDGKEERGQQQ